MTANAPNPGAHKRRQLSELKRKLRPKYLGKFGIHAIGARTSENAICIYVTGGSSDREDALNSLRDEVAPHNLVVVEEDPPRMA